jgi:DNA-binding transcriptional LysR family regulator
MWNSDMELRHLRYVVAVADTLHFGQAAQRLNLSQPPLSQQIRQLEDELKVKLFQRTKRQVQLTEAGKLFVEEARVILAHAEQAANLAMRINTNEVRQITIGVAGPADARIFVEILGAFGRRHPKVRISLQNMSTTDQADALREGRLHAGFLTLPIDDSNLVTETIMQQPVMIALPHNHPLATRSRVPLLALASEPHIMFARHLSPRFFDAVVDSCRDAGLSLNIVHEVDNLYTACALVAAGLGVCFVPAGIQEGRSTSIVLRPLKPALPHLDMHMALAYRRQPTCKLAQLFVDVVREVVAQRTEPKASQLASA